MKSIANFCFVSNALGEYYRMHGCFPDSSMPLVEGGPEYSWRVAIMPAIGGRFREAYDELDFSLPWNAPHNIKVADSLRDTVELHCFRSPLGVRSHDSCSNFVGVSETHAWPYKRPHRARRVFSESSSFTLIEIPNSDIHWMEPRDLPESEW